MRPRHSRVLNTLYAKRVVVLVPDLELRVMNEVLLTGVWCLV